MRSEWTLRGLHRAKLLLLFVMLTLSGASSASARMQLDLAVTLEDSVLLQHQTIYMIARLRNSSSEQIADIAPLAPGRGYLRLQLFQEGNESPIPASIPMDGGNGGSPGMVLLPGEVSTEARDLLTYFGVRGAEGRPAGIPSWWPALQPGSYILKATMTVHTGVERSIQQMTIKAADVRFRVLPIGAAPAQERLLREFFMDGRPGSGDIGQYSMAARRWLNKFYQSPFLIRVFRDTGAEMGKVPIDQVLQSLRRLRVRPERRAALLAVRCLVDPQVRHRDPAWYRRLIKQVPSQIERDVLDSWDRGRVR